jgi:hypothetical protein
MGGQTASRIVAAGGRVNRRSFAMLRMTISESGQTVRLAV